MKKIFIALGLFIMIAVIPAKAQMMLEDSVISFPIIMGSYGYQFTGGDMTERFGNSSTLGVNFLFKTKDNWLYGADFNYFFGSNIKNIDEMLSGLMTDQGYIIDGNGVYATYSANERGHYGGIKGGKIFPVVGPNPNSGIFVLGGLGYLRHYIDLDNEQNVAPQISNDYKYGYDYLTDGIYSTQFIGYIHFGNDRVFNFFGGLEIMEGFTRGKRKYLFNEMKPDDSKRFEMLYTIKIGWMIPVYKKASQVYFYE